MFGFVCVRAIWAGVGAEASKVSSEVGPKGGDVLCV